MLPWNFNFSYEQWFLIELSPLTETEDRLGPRILGCYISESNSYQSLTTESEVNLPRGRRLTKSRVPSAIFNHSKGAETQMLEGW